MLWIAFQHLESQSLTERVEINRLVIAPRWMKIALTAFKINVICDNNGNCVAMKLGCVPMLVRTGKNENNVRYL